MGLFTITLRRVISIGLGRDSSATRATVDVCFKMISSRLLTDLGSSLIHLIFDNDRSMQDEQHHSTRYTTMSYIRKNMKYVLPPLARSALTETVSRNICWTKRATSRYRWGGPACVSCHLGVTLLGRKLYKILD